MDLRGVATPGTHPHHRATRRRRGRLGPPPPGTGALRGAWPTGHDVTEIVAQALAQPYGNPCPVTAGAVRSLVTNALHGTHALLTDPSARKYPEEDQMIKLVAAVRRRPGMTRSEYADYVENVHGGIALAKKLTLRKYVQNNVFDAAYGATGDTGYQVTLPRDSVTELYFDDVESMGQTFADPYTRDVVGPDGANFSDLPAALSLIVEEDRIEAPRPAPGTVKVLHFLKAAEGSAPGAFQQGLRQAHEDVLADPSGPARHIRGHEWNTALPGDGMAAYFGGTSQQPAYEAYSALWFDEADALVGFRAYQRALAGRAEKHGALFQPSLSFFLLTREVVIFDDLTEE